MPLFFREDKKVSIKTDVDDTRSADAGESPKVVPQEGVHSGLDESRSMHGRLELEPSAVPSFASGEVVPSRKKKPVNWVLIAATVWLTVPAVVMLFLMTTDGFTRNYVMARLQVVMRDDSSAIAYYSNALQLKQDSKALEARADCYSSIGDLENERRDLRALVKSIDIRKQHSWQYLRHFHRLAALEARLGDVDNAVGIYRLCSTLGAGSKSDTHYAKDAAFKLLLLGDLPGSKELLSQIEKSRQEKSDLISDTFVGRSDGYLYLLQALVYRESGDKQKALDSLRAIGDKYVYAFRDSRARSGSKGEIVPWSLEALICLDDRDTAKARSLVKEIESELNGKDKSEPIVDVVKGWLLLEEGRLDDCLKLTATTLAFEDDKDESIVSQNLRAALHLIRKNAFLQKNRAEQANREDELYRQAHVTGRVFTPICFRDQER